MTHVVEPYRLGRIDASKMKFSDPRMTITEVVPYVWQGALPQHGTVFDLTGKAHAFVLCPAELDLHGCEITYKPFQDNARDRVTTPPTIVGTRLDELLILADEINARTREGAPSFVLCQWGYNRSGLLVGLAMARRGYSIDDILRIMRAARGPHPCGFGEALNNPNFLAAVAAVASKGATTTSTPEPAAAEEHVEKLGLWAQRFGAEGGHWMSVSGTLVLGDSADEVLKALENGQDGAFFYRPTPYDPKFKGYPKLDQVKPVAHVARIDRQPRHMVELRAAPLGVEKIDARVVEIVFSADKLERGERAYNPSIAVFRDKLVTSIRVERDLVSRYFLATLDPETGAIDDLRSVGNPTNARIGRGFEDMRLFTRTRRSETTLHAVATCATPRPSMFVIDFADNGDAIRAYPQVSPRDEKNWMPLVTTAGPRDELRFLYALEPTPSIVRFDDQKHIVRPSPETIPPSGGSLRGGSQVIPFGGYGFLCVVHHVHWREGQPVYWHRFVEFDRFLQVVRVSRPWCFGDPNAYKNKTGIEFVAGIAVWAGAYLLSFGRADRSAYVAHVSPDEIERLLDAPPER